MQQHITVSGILPATIAHYVEHFLECGTCFKRMKTMIMKRDYKLMFEGFMFRALCSALDEYLFTFRQFVFACDDHSLIEFFKRMKKSMQQMRNLSFTLAIHPDDTSVTPPMGSQFLGYLYREILRSTERGYITVLMFILKRCCHVYFKHLQKWIFNALLDDPSNELFVCFIDHYRPQTKYFYDKAYFLRKEAVPGFFQSYEDQILQCGKYTMLLKSFKPNHPLFEIKHPAISVCLTFEEIQQLEIDCARYEQAARRVCSNPISVRQMFEARAERKRQFLTMVNKRARETLEKWTDEQQHVAMMVAEQKRKLHDELSAQLEDSRLRKLADRRASVELELKMLRQSEAHEDDRLLRVNINLRKRIEYYQELSELLEEDEREELARSLRKYSVHESSTGTRTSQTKASSSTAEYQSCTGDEDEEEFEPSVYSECLSEEHERKCDENEKHIVNSCLSPLQADDQNANLALGAGGDNPAVPVFQRSISDIINCNQDPEEVLLNNMQQNRQHMLSSSNMQRCLEQKSHKPSSVSVQVPTLSEAQRNKLKVLTQEFGRTDNNTEPSDYNLNALPDSELSDLQRNRRRMMQNVNFSTSETDPAYQRAQLRLNFDSDCARNRRKVLESEFGIILQKNTEIVTPMSTTSDSPLPESEANQQDTEDDKNNNNNDSNEQLTLTTSSILVKLRDDELEVTKEALESEEQPDNDIDINYLEDSGLLPDYSSPYKRCEELLQSNFTCASRCPHMRLSAMGATATVAVNDMGNLNVMSVITLTDFLKKSVVIPMRTHLELVNNEVMRMFLVDLQVIEHLRSLRHYFLLMDGEFASIICDGIILKLEEGAQPNNLLNYQTLHGILETALGSSITGTHKNAENLSFIVSDIPEKFDLSSPNVLGTLTLSYRIDWPLNLILNPETLEQYSNIFKYLMKVRRISWVLERAYQILKEALKQNGRDILKSPQYRRVQQMRHKFYHFVQALQNHITSNALQASWKTFKDDILQAKSIEDIYRKHTNYVKRILFLCMLNRKSVNYLNTIESIFKILLKFYK